MFFNEQPLLQNYRINYEKVKVVIEKFIFF